jgi:hypothetical protein
MFYHFSQGRIYGGESGTIAPGPSQNRNRTHRFHWNICFSKITKKRVSLFSYYKVKKVNLFLCLTNKALRHEGVRGSECIDPHFLDLGTSWRLVVSFTPLPLYPRERAPGTHLIGGWVEPRADVDNVEKRKFLILPGLELRPLGRPVRNQSLYRLRYPGS